MSDSGSLIGLEFASSSPVISSDLAIDVTLKSPSEPDFVVRRDSLGTRVIPTAQLAPRKSQKLRDEVSIVEQPIGNYARYVVLLPEGQQLLIGILPNDVVINVATYRVSGINKALTSSQTYRFLDVELQSESKQVRTSMCRNCPCTKYAN